MKSQLIWKDPDAGKDWGQEEKGTTEDEVVGWHHWLDGHVFGWTLGVGNEQGGWCAAVSGVAKTEFMGWTRLSDWTELSWTSLSELKSPVHPVFYQDLHSSVTGCCFFAIISLHLTLAATLIFWFLPYQVISVSSLVFVPLLILCVTYCFSLELAPCQSDFSSTFISSESPSLFK